MSKKKYKKRHHSSTVTAKRQAEQERIADEIDRNRKRMDPTARNLLLGDLVFLCIIILLEQRSMITTTVSNLATIVGVILLLLALWFQFGRKNKDGHSGPQL